MPTLYYGYKALFEKENFIINIIIFYVVIIVSQYLLFIILKINTLPYIFRYLSCVGTFIIFGGYMIHTLMPAENLLFKDPISKKYGYKGHT